MGIRRFIIHAIYEREFPDDWSDEDCLFYLNDSSSCANNIFNAMASQYDEKEGCHCMTTVCEVSTSEKEVDIFGYEIFTS